jgi:hypothetical protein
MVCGEWMHFRCVISLRFVCGFLPNRGQNKIPDPERDFSFRPVPCHPAPAEREVRLLSVVDFRRGYALARKLELQIRDFRKCCKSEISNLESEINCRHALSRYKTP